MKKLLVIGSTCVDVVLRIDHLPSTGEDLHPSSQNFRMGGCAYNVAKVALANSIPLHFTTLVGGGVFGDFVWNHLEGDGFTGPVRIAAKENGCCYCFVEKNGERTFLSVHGVEYSFDPSYMIDAETFDYTYICGLEVEEPTGDTLISWLTAHPQTGTLLYAPGPRGVLIPKDKTNRIFLLHPILHLNEQEVLELSGFNGSKTHPALQDVESAARLLQKRTENIVIVTLGGNGVFWLSKDGSAHHLPGEKVEVIDTIGAGDAHCGAVLTGFCRSMEEVDVMRAANRVAASVVSTEGATLSKEDYIKPFHL